ncbi:MAG: MFS transporter [Dehalococcoidia bacterium]
MSQQQPQDLSTVPKAAIADQRSSSYRYVIAALGMLLNVSFGLSFFAVSPVTPLIMEDYGVNRSAVALLTGLVILVQSGFAIPGGMLVGRVGLKKLFAVAWLMAAAPSLSFLATGFPMLLAIRVVYGLSFAVIIPAIGPLLMQWFRPREIPVINGLNLAMTTLGIAISTFATAPLAEAVGWKVALSLYGGVSLFGAACWVVLGRVEPVQRSGSHLSPRQVWQILRSRTTLLLALADAGPFAQYVALTAWLPTFYHEVHGMSLSEAGSTVGLLPLTGVITVLLAGVLSMRVRRRRPFLIVPGVIVGFGGFGCFLLAGSPLIYPALILLGFGSWFYLPVLLTIPMELPDVEPGHVSVVWAAIMSFGGIMSFVSPLMVGALTDSLGTYLPGFVIFAVLAGSLALAGFLMPETGVRDL